MPYQLFHDLFPDMAGAETRSITVLADQAETGLPPGDYAFCEMFCNERGCDCRRVLFYVVASFRKGPEAVIGWGWEPPEFYAKWLHDDDPRMITELIGPSLNPGSPETELADGILYLARNVLLRDEAYVERIKRHYRHFRTRIDGKSITISRRHRKKRRKRKAGGTGKK